MHVGTKVAALVSTQLTRHPSARAQRWLRLYGQQRLASAFQFYVVTLAVVYSSYKMSFTMCEVLWWVGLGGIVG